LVKVGKLILLNLILLFWAFSLRQNNVVKRYFLQLALYITLAFNGLQLGEGGDY